MLKKQNVAGEGRAATASSWAVGLGLLASSVFFLWFVNRHYPIRHWLFWTYLKCWAASLVFFVSAVVSGNAILLRVLRRTLPLAEHLVTSFALGAFAFFACVFVSGCCGYFGSGLFFAVPLLLTLAGGRAAMRLGRRVWRHLSYFCSRPRRPAALWMAVAASFGCVCVAMIYFPTLTPDNVAYDVRWYHIPIAEHYIAEGAVRRFAEGWFLGAYPHLASFYFAWALLMPASSYFDRVELIAHLEVVFFLVTLVGIAPIVRLVLPRTRAPVAWVSLFVFPGIFVYDSSLHAGADHIAALFAVPVFTLFLRALRGFSTRYLALFALLAAAVIDTKLSAVIAVAFPVLAVVAVGLYRLVRPSPALDRRAVGRGLLVSAAIGLLATTPFWLRNWIFYGDPLYPKLSHFLAVTPYTPDFQVPLDNWFYPAKYHAPHTWSGVVRSLRAVFDFSFGPYDWSVQPRPAPLFGSLFTLLLVTVPFLGKQWRLWLLLAASNFGVFVWFQIHHFERYLQTILPWMAASLCVCTILIWRRHLVVRSLLVVLLSVQMVWSADAYFTKHAMVDTPFKSAWNLLAAGKIAAGDKAKYKERFRIPNGWDHIGAKLPSDAKVLAHEVHMHWALERASVADWQGSQGGISYVRSGDLRGVYDLLRGLGVTHLAYDRQHSRGNDTLGSDLLFFRFCEQLGLKPFDADGMRVVEMPKVPPLSSAKPEQVALFSCGSTYSSGIYDVTQLTKSDYDPNKKYPKPIRRVANDSSAADAKPLLSDVTYAVIENSCHKSLASVIKGAGLTKLAARGDWDLYSRPLASPEPVINVSAPPRPRS